MAQNGGKREGAGRKAGSRNSLTQKLLREVISVDDQAAIVRKGLEKAKSGDNDLIKFFLEHIHGKVPQQLDVNSTSQLEVIFFTPEKMPLDPRTELNSNKKT